MAAKILRANMADILGSDEELAADIIEGEANVHGAKSCRKGKISCQYLKRPK